MIKPLSRPSAKAVSPVMVIMARACSKLARPEAKILNSSTSIFTVAAGWPADVRAVHPGVAAVDGPHQVAQALSVAAGVRQEDSSIFTSSSLGKTL